MSLSKAFADDVDPEEIEEAITPCIHCGLLRHEHARKFKCLFEPTEFDLGSGTRESH